MVAACAEHMGWDAAALEIQETLESRTGDASSGLGGLASCVKLSVTRGRAIIPFAIAFFSCRAPNSSINLC